MFNVQPSTREKSNEMRWIFDESHRKSGESVVLHTTYHFDAAHLQKYFALRASIANELHVLGNLLLRSDCVSRLRLNF